MIGTLDPAIREVTVVGAGISGLFAAYSLDRAGYEVTLIEKAPRAGGLIHTEITPWGPAERAAHSVLATPAFRELCADLDIELVPVNQDAKARYILRNGRFRRMPLSVPEILTAMGRMLFVRAADSDELTVHDWAVRHLGRAAANYLLQPFVLGIYGASASELDTRAILPSLWIPQGHTLRRQISTLRKKRRKRVDSRMMAPALGMSALVSRLELRLKERLSERFHLNRPLVSLPSASNLVICTPAYETARLLEPVAPEAAAALESVEYAPLVTATVFFREDSIQRRFKGVGVLIPPTENRRALGVLFNSSAFPGRVDADAMGEGKPVSFTMILGGTLRPELLKADDETLKKIIHEEFKALFRVNEHPVHMEIWRHEKAIPVYSADLRRTWETLRSTWASTPGHVIFGNYTGEVSIRGMLESAHQLAE